MSDGTSRTVDCPECGEAFDPSAAGGWCTNPGCGEWQYDPSEGDAGREPAADGSGQGDSDGDGAEEHRDGTDAGAATGDADVPAGPIGGGAAGPAEGSASDGDADVPAGPIGGGAAGPAEPTGQGESSASDGDADVPAGRIGGRAAGPAEPTGQGEGSASEGVDDSPACPDCGTAVEPDDSFCRSCGADVSTLTSGALTACPECGTDVEPADSFCRNCGENLDAHRSEGASGTSPGSERAGPDGRREDDGPESVVLTVRDHEIQVTDGDTVGKRVRNIVVDTGGDETDAVRIHREHIRFDREDGRFYLVDLAENSTVVNGQSLERGDRVPISHGDRIELSNVARLRVKDA